MIELAFVTCLAAAPDECQDRSLLFEKGTPQSCMVMAGPHLAQWVNEHPQWTVARWKCRSFTPGQMPQDI